MQVCLPRTGSRNPLTITLNGRDVSDAFRPGGAPNTLVGLVTGLALVRNRLSVEGSSVRRSIRTAPRLRS